MDNNDIKYYLQSLRIKSSRRKKRWQYEDLNKKLIRLFREQSNISKEIFNLGYEELTPPVQRGWKRYFVLRKDVARSKDTKFFQGILDKINTTGYSWRKDFKVKIRKHGKKIYVVEEQALKRLWPQFFKEMRFTDLEKKYFDLTMVHEAFGKGFLWLYVFTEPWRFELKVEPNIIRRTKIKNYDLERRSDEIKKYFERNHLMPKLQKLLHGQYQWRLRYAYEGDREKYKYHPFRNRSLADILDEYRPGPTLRILHHNPRKSRGFSFVRAFLRWLQKFSYD